MMKLIFDTLSKVCVILRSVATKNLRTAEAAKQKFGAKILRLRFAPLRMTPKDDTFFYSEDEI